MTTTKYDPSIQALLSQCHDDWGNPEENRTGLVPYGIDLLDLSLWGIDVINGELILMMGQEGNRKTTFAQNVVCNYMTWMQDRNTIPPFTVIDTLESGMHPKRYRDTLIANMASRYIIRQGHLPNQACPACGTPKCKELNLSPEFLRYKSRSKQQLEAIDYAIDTMNDWPLYIYGANEDQGNTRSLAYASKGKNARWLRLIDDLGAKILLVDHVQQYYFEHDTTDYEKQLRSIAAIGDIVAGKNVVFFLLSQVSLTSVRDAQSGSGKLGASGGQKAAQEANVVMLTKYVPGSGQMLVSVDKSRKSTTFYAYQNLDDSSGAFYGKATAEGDM